MYFSEVWNILYRKLISSQGLTLVNAATNCGNLQHSLHMTFSSLKLLDCCELQQHICKYICMTLSNFQGLAIPMVGGLGLLGNIAAIVVLRSVFSLINFHAFALYELHFTFRVTTTNNIRKEAKYNKGFNTLCTHHFLYFCQCFLRAGVPSLS